MESRINNNWEKEIRYSKLQNFLYFVKKAWLLPYVPLFLAWYLATITPYNYTSAYNNGILGIIEHDVTQSVKCEDNGICSQKEYRLQVENWVTTEQERENTIWGDWKIEKIWDWSSPKTFNEDRSVSHLKNGTTMKTTMFEYPENGYFWSFKSGIPETWINTSYTKKTVEDILSIWNTWTDFERANNFILWPENLPSEDDIQKIIWDLRQLIQSWKLTWSIDISGFSSPEGREAKDLVSNQGISYNDNYNLALERAKYIQERLQEIPEISPYIWETSAIVNTLSEEDIWEIQRIFNIQSLDDIQERLKMLNKGILNISDIDQSIISWLFQRWVNIKYDYLLSEKVTWWKSENKFMYINTPFNEIFISTVLLIAFGFSISFWVTQWYGNIMKDYIKNPASKKWKRAANFLWEDEVQKIANLQAKIKTL